MSMKIPDSPNVIGTQPVLRQVDSVNPQFERPNFKLDVSQPAQAMKDVGKAYANYVDYNTNIWMGAACNQFTHDLMSEEQRLKDTHKELAANDLYAKLEKYATGVLDDITGEPKDDGRVRISNPELQKRFRDWANKQMPAFQSRMMNYSASELDKANKEVLKKGIEDNNNFILGSTMEGAKEQFEAAWGNYLRAAQLSAAGMPVDYQRAEAARMMDEAVFAKQKVLADNNIVEALNWYYGVPEVQKAMSSKSRAAFFDEVDKNYESQGGAWVAEQLAAGGSGFEGGGYLDPAVLKAAFPTKNESEIGAMSAKVFAKGREINDARLKAQQGMKEHHLSAVQSKATTVDLNDPMAVMQVYQDYRTADPQAADDWLNSVQQGLADQKVLDDFAKMFPDGDPRDELLSSGFDEEAYEQEYNETREMFRRAKGYYKMADETPSNMVGDIRADIIKQQNAKARAKLDAEFEKQYGTRKQYVQKRKDAYLYGSNLTPPTAQELEDLKNGKQIERENVTWDANFRGFGAGALTAEQMDMLRRYDAVIEKNAAWLNSGVYAEYTGKAASGLYHGEEVEALKGMPIALRNNLAQIVHYNDRYNDVLRINPYLTEDVVKHVKDYKKKSKDYLNNIKREAVKEFDRYRQTGASYPMRNSVEYETMLNNIVQNAESPSKTMTEAYINAEAADYLQTQKINPYLNPEAAREALEDVDLLPMNLKVAKKIDKNITAEKWADAIISATPREKRRVVAPYREAIIKTIEDTGDASAWYNFIDGIGGQQ